VTSFPASSSVSPGDWISIDGGTDGQVIELNWRTTHVLTARRDLAIVPNSTIAKSKIVNLVHHSPPAPLRDQQRRLTPQPADC
jgi:small-conductance mechanosensitive channel